MTSTTTPGKVDWMAHGLPTQDTGTGRTTALTLIRQDLATCRLDDAAEEIARPIDDSPDGFALTLSPGPCRPVRRSRLAGVGASVETLLEPRPSTIRPHTPIKVARRTSTEIRTLIVTDPEGKLLGIVRRGDVDDSRQ